MFQFTETSSGIALQNIKKTKYSCNMYYLKVNLTSSEIKIYRVL